MTQPADAAVFPRSSLLAAQEREKVAVFAR